MKIERINENQIRCTLTSTDLSSRNLNLGELAYGTAKAKKLFHEMIQEASAEFGFEADDTPLMVEAIPLSAESIMLIITKIEDPEELDTRFSRFSPANDEDQPMNALANQLLEGAGDLLNLLSENSKNETLDLHADSDGTSADSDNSDATKDSARVFTFNSLDDVCRAARICIPVCDVPNTLYKHPLEGRYYLIVHQNADNTDTFNRLCNLLSEYSTSTGSTAPYALEAYYEEHYDTIVKEHALMTLSKL